MNKPTKFICSLLVVCITSLVIYANGAQAGVRFLSETEEGGFFQSNEQAFSCPTTFNKTCAAPSVGSGVSCGGKYESCVCPADYKYQIAADCPYTGQVPDTTSEVCGGKYKLCSCPSDYSSTCSTGNMSPKPTAVACGGKYKESDCQCPSDWFVASSCNTSGKELGGTVCNSPDGVKYFSTCSCSSTYLQCENGGDTGATTCKNSYESYTRYSKCKENDLDCAGEVKALFPTAKVITKSEELPIDPISAKLVVSGDIKSEGGTLTLREGAEIVSGAALSPKCQAGTLDVFRVYAGYQADPATAFTATVDIPLTIRNLNVEKNATFTINKDLTLETIALPAGKTFTANAPGTAKTIFTKAVNAEGNLTVSNIDAKDTLTATGGTFVFKKGGTFAKTLYTSSTKGGNLTFMDGTFNLYQLYLQSNAERKQSGSGNSIYYTATPGTAVNVYVTNATLDILPGTSSYSTGIYLRSVGAGGINMSNSKIYLNNSEFSVSSSNPTYGKFRVSLSGGSVMQGISKFTYSSAYGFQFYFPAGAGASKVMLQGGTTLQPTSSSKPAYARIVHSNNFSVTPSYNSYSSPNVSPASDSGVYGNVTTFAGSTFCDKDAYCNNLSGHSDTCEYPYSAQPTYVYYTKYYSSSSYSYSRATITCSSCTRNGKTYYGSAKGKSCYISYGDPVQACRYIVEDRAYQDCINDSNNGSGSSGGYYNCNTECDERYKEKYYPCGSYSYQYSGMGGYEISSCLREAPMCTEDLSEGRIDSYDEEWCLTALEKTSKNSYSPYY